MCNSTRFDEVELGSFTRCSPLVANMQLLEWRAGRHDVQGPFPLFEVSENMGTSGSALYLRTNRFDFRALASCATLRSSCCLWVQMRPCQTKSRSAGYVVAGVSSDVCALDVPSVSSSVIINLEVSLMGCLVAAINIACACLVDRLTLNLETLRRLSQRMPRFRRANQSLKSGARHFSFTCPSAFVPFQLGRRKQAIIQLDVDRVDGLG